MSMTVKLLLLLTAAFVVVQIASAETNIAVLSRPAAATQNEHYLSNRAPLLPSILIKLPVGTVKPRGWLLETLKRQRSGLTGHLPKVSAWLQKEENAWLSRDGRGKWGWEEVPYWLRGYISLGQLLDDKAMEHESQIWIEAVIAGQRSDGHFGPLRVFGDDESQDFWANMIMLNCLQTYYEYSEDQRVLELMTKFFQYQLTIPEEKLLTHYWQFYRGGDNLYSVYWLYNRTGGAWLLDLADKIHRNTANWRLPNGLPNWHSVNVAQAFGEPATYYLQSQDADDLAAAYRNFKSIRTKYGQVPGGMFGADENARVGYDDPRQAIETCAIVEQMRSDELLLCITGDTYWADHVEEVAFNTLSAAFMPDYRSLRYLTSPNLASSDRQSHRPGVDNFGPAFTMNPLSHRCCQHNHSQGWPYFVEHLWTATADNGLCASIYGPSEVRAEVGDGVEVQITEETRYPFEEKIILTLSLPKATTFPLYLRIPKWSPKSEVYVNDAAVARDVAPSTYVRIHRAWQPGDIVQLRLPMSVTLHRWKANHNSISIDRGPLTFSLKIGEQYVKHDPVETVLQDSQWQKDVDREKWPAFEILATTPWNYGLVVNNGAPEESFTVEERDWPADDYPFTVDHVPISLKCTARRIPEWGLDLTGLCAQLQDSPVYSSSPNETITLIPMGAARLRISSFPEVRYDRNLDSWRSGESGIRAYEPRASHCNSTDTVLALADGLEPCASNDRGIPRHSFLPHHGTKEWFEAKFNEPRLVDQVSVYWCDDVSDREGLDEQLTETFDNVLFPDICRVPKKWKLLYVADGAWQEVNSSGSFGVEANKYNTVSFEPVTTSALRIEVELSKGASGGILEWQIGRPVEK